MVNSGSPWRNKKEISEIFPAASGFWFLLIVVTKFCGEGRILKKICSGNICWNNETNFVSVTIRRTLTIMLTRSRHQKCSATNFAKFTRKHLCQSVFLNKIADQAWAYNFIKKETLAQVFSCEFWEISKNTFFIEHLRMTISG